MTALVQSDSTPVETPDIVDECHTCLAAVLWRGNITGFGKGVQFTYKHLTLFLSNEWLDDEMIDAGSNWILCHVQASGQTEIANCLHIQQLQHVHTKKSLMLPGLNWTISLVHTTLTSSSSLFMFLGIIGHFYKLIYPMQPTHMLMACTMKFLCCLQLSTLFNAGEPRFPLIYLIFNLSPSISIYCSSMMAFHVAL